MRYSSRHRFQNTVAESIITLPAAAVLATLLWWLPQGGYSNGAMLGWLAYALTTYVLIEMNTAYKLLRIPSRFISSLYLIMLAACGFVHQLQNGTIAALTIACSIACLFSTYDVHQPSTATLHTYLLLSLGSLAYPPLLLLYPIMFLCQAIYMRSLTGKTFTAGLIGLLLPYWLWAVVCMLQTDISSLYAQWLAIIEPINTPILAIQHSEPITSAFWLRAWTTLHTGSSLEQLDYTVLASNPMRLIPLAVAAVVIGILGLTGLIHYIRKHYDDSIKVRMCFYTFLTFQVVLTLWMLFQPRQFPHLFPSLLLVTAPTAAHFFTFTHTRATNFWFFACSLLLIAVAAATLALPSFSPDSTPIIPTYDIQAISSEWFGTHP
ncbi:MAG: hypothetical protein J5486_02985 [Bacteroidaceae bacterium]|nr:hypothetical protein [Bacteroidaceae bacterium]